jgi:hypothetical protein
VSNEELQPPRPHQTPDPLPAIRQATSARKPVPSKGDRGDRSSAGANRVAQKTKIALWGAPGSGKTTLLAALSIALSQDNDAAGKWVMYPQNFVSAEIISNHAHQLITEHRFPEATPIGSLQPVSVVLLGDLTGSKFAPSRRFWRRGPMTTNLELELVDISGEAYGHDPAGVSSDFVVETIHQMSHAQGLIYLFDPVAELHRRNQSEYVSRVLTNLAMDMKDRLSGPYLPQQLSVCITKFDHPDIFQQARRLGLVDENLRVPDNNAKRFFDLYCDGAFWADDERSFAGAQYIRNQLRTYFGADRIRYFVTSSIGLRRRRADPGDPYTPAKIDPDDFVNVRDQGGELMIRGSIEPINVLEPLISLYQRIAMG